MKKTIKKMFALVLAVITVATLFAGCSVKSDSKNSLKLGFDPTFPPMGFRDESGKYVGFDIDVAKKAVTYMDGYDDVELIPIDWDAKDQELKAGTIDCIWNGFTMHVETRDEDYAWTDAYMNNSQVIVINKNSEITKAEDLAGKTVAVQKDSSGLAAINDTPEFKNTLGKVIEIGDYESALLELESGSVDAIVMDEIVIGYKISQGKDQFKILDKVLAEEEYGIAFAKNNTKTRDAVQAALEKMNEDGSLAKISKEWFSKDITTIGK